ncbi:zinc-activated ligand-gated ion channel-like isoform X1 [Epinephelus fuscoguttatus]|uniref:zinc-activated ligand-gated ion channel-like isoform X1 n=2 Tax=Epinephelus fuscoguttatus TaxID=293821 RepID=UPI0020CFFCDE|nr:zinc-activated ligand-gated ion channel-like isoform X1 [Epinephelus fuscoguttatus]
MVRFSTHSLWKAVLFLGLLIVGCPHAESTCKSRRCLAEILANKKFVSQPQYENCSQMIMVPFIEYQTLSVDTKNLRLNSRLQASLKWEDPELAWDTSVYPYDQVVLPVSKVWTPELRVTNGITTTMRHSSHDLLVISNGTVKHSVIITAEVNCEVNLFNYPFAWDACPVAIQTWSDDGCGTLLEFEQLKMVDGTHGDWQTDNAFLARQTDERNYILVQLSIKYTNPFITLMLPSILIVLADVVSFALPLGGGERNSFKVTLVLSFTMFLIILNDQLPGDSACSPVIRTHFCICLVLLVVSMLASMVMTRLAKDGSLILCCCSPVQRKKKDDEEDKADISVVQVDGTVENTRMLRKVLNFLENLDAQTLESERHQMFANKLDKAFFWLYFILAILYFSAMTYVMVNYKCTVNHFDFWY